MKCPNCETENPDIAQFCQGCGDPLSLVCEQCKTVNSPTAKFCMTCGAELEGIQESEKDPRLSKLRDTAPRGLQEKLREAGVEIEGERKPVTILFTDIVGSTAMAEKIDPEEWKEIVSGAHQRVGEAIYRYEGTIAQLLGDGLLAFFGAPITHEDDPIRAVHAALEILESIADYERELAGYVDSFQVRIGINTGEVVVGNIGNDMHMEYLAIGDAVNVAARMQSAADSGKILLSENSARLVRTDFDLNELGEILIKGKKDPLDVFEVVDAKAVPERRRGIEGLFSPMVGREDEIVKLSASLTSLREGRGQIVAIVGEAGVGKTRLLEEAKYLEPGNNDTSNEESESVSSYVPSSSILWLEGRSLSYGRSLSFWTITQLLLSDLGLSEGAHEAKIKVALRQRLLELYGEEQGEVLMFLTLLLGLKQTGEAQELIQQLDGETMKRQILMSVNEYFTRVASESPTVLVLEDMHWSDPSSLETIERLFDLTDRVPLMILILMRIDRDHDSWQTKLKAETDFAHRFIEIHLKRLSSSASDQIVNHLLEIAELPESLRTFILSRSEGNPFYLEEIVRNLIDQGVIVREDHAWRATKEITEVDIPDTLHGVLLARIDQLEKDVRDTLQMASVIGKSFLYRLLEAIPEAELQLDEHLVRLQRVDLVRERARWPELEYIFKHSLMQEAAYNSLLAERRRTFHERVGEALEELFPDRIEDFLGLLAHHFYSAESYDKAADYLIRAQDYAYSKGSILEAIDFRTLALETYMKLEDPVMVGHMEMGLGWLHWARGDRQVSLEHSYRGVSILEKEGETKELAMAVSEVSRMHMVAANYDQAIKWGERARKLAERLDDQEVLIQVLNTVGASHTQSGDIERGLTELKESLRLSLELDQPNNVGRAYYNLGELLIHIGNYAEARLHLEELYNYSLMHNPNYERPALSILIFVDWLFGSWASAIDKISDIHRMRYFGISDVWRRRIFALIYNDLGKAAEACQELESFASIAVRTGELQTVVPYLGQMARAYDALGRETETIRVIQQYLEFIDGNSYFDKDSIMPLLFACQWYCNNSAPESLDEARACVSRMQKAHEQFGTPEAEAALAEGRGSLALVEGQVPQAVKYFQDALKIWEILERPYDQARALGGHGQALVHANDIDAGRLVLDQAMRIFESLADQLEDSEHRRSFLASQLVDQIRQKREILEADK